MNRVVLMGRLTRDPDIRRSGETTIARFTLAVDRRKRDEADFISCVAFNKVAEFADKYLNQGTKICMDGRIQTGKYTNRDGQVVYTTDVIADNIEFAESKQSSQPQPQPKPQTPAEQDGFIPDPLLDENLPFA